MPPNIQFNWIKRLYRANRSCGLAKRAGLQGWQWIKIHQIFILVEFWLFLPVILSLSLNKYFFAFVALWRFVFVFKTISKLLACVSQNSRRLFGSEKLFYMPAIYQQIFSFSFVLKAKQKNRRSTRNFPLVFGLKPLLRIKGDWISKISFGPEKSSGVLRDARLAVVMETRYIGSRYSAPLRKFKQFYFLPDLVIQANNCTTCVCGERSFITLSSDSKSLRKRSLVPSVNEMC